MWQKLLFSVDIFHATTSLHRKKNLRSLHSCWENSLDSIIEFGIAMWCFDHSPVKKACSLIFKLKSSLFNSDMSPVQWRHRIANFLGNLKWRGISIGQHITYCTCVLFQGIHLGNVQSVSSPLQPSTTGRDISWKCYLNELDRKRMKENGFETRFQRLVLLP